MADVEKRFVFYGEWLNNIKSLDQATQDKVIADIVRYGTNEDMFYSDDPVVSTIVFAKYLQNTISPLYPV